LFDGSTHYIVQGVGGGKLRPIITPVKESVYQYSGIGICMMLVTEQTLTVQWYIEDDAGAPVLADELTLSSPRHD